MRMTQEIGAEDASRINFQPVAEIALPPTWFREKGIEFHPETDDLDRYGFAPFWLDGKPFALMHYMNGPNESVSLLAGDMGDNEVRVATHVSAVAEAFGLSPSLFSWRENGEHVSFSRVGIAPATA